MKRQAVNFKHISLTDLKVKVPHGARSGAVLKAWTKADVTAKWEATSWAKKLSARVQRAKLNDFERFVVKVTKQKVGLLCRAFFGRRVGGGTLSDSPCGCFPLTNSATASSPRSLPSSRRPTKPVAVSLLYLPSQ